MMVVFWRKLLAERSRRGGCECCGGHGDRPSGMERTG